MADVHRDPDWWWLVGGRRRRRWPGWSAPCTSRPKTASATVDALAVVLVGRGRGRRSSAGGAGPWRRSSSSSPPLDTYIAARLPGRSGLPRPSRSPSTPSPSAAERRASYVAAAVMTSVLVGARVVVDGDVGAEDLLLAGWAAASRARRRRHARPSGAGRVHRGAPRGGAATPDGRGPPADRPRPPRQRRPLDGHDQRAVRRRRPRDRPPPASRPTAALEAIRVASRDVLDELAAMLGVLRDEPPPTGPPTPDLARLGGLVDSSPTGRPRRRPARRRRRRPPSPPAVPRPPTGSCRRR